ncbi:hypothetical protein PCURB6_14970 [Paenibacillus curdlanolyticus]|nr:hypothetical protein PCURB6_14970 [Paenibacillus curdlanolyticus]
MKQIIQDENLGVVVGVAEDGSYFENERLSRLDADVLIVNLMISHVNGFNTIEKMLSNGFKGEIVMLSNASSKSMIAKAYEIGVDFYIQKPINKIEVMSILKKIGSHLETKRRLYRMKEAYQLRAQLTSTEVQILELIHKGYTQSSISEKMCISIKTVKNHLFNALKKTGLSKSKLLAEKIRLD